MLSTCYVEIVVLIIRSVRSDSYTHDWDHDGGHYAENEGSDQEKDHHAVHAVEETFVQCLHAVLHLELRLGFFSVDVMVIRLVASHFHSPLVSRHAEVLLGLNFNVLQASVRDD